MVPTQAEWLSVLHHKSECFTIKVSDRMVQLPCRYGIQAEWQRFHNLHKLSSFNSFHNYHKADNK